MHCLDGGEQIHGLERRAFSARHAAGTTLQTVSGIPRKVLALTIALGTGDIGRFADPTGFASYAPHGQQPAQSNKQKKGERTKCMRTSTWPGAFVETALCGAANTSSASTRKERPPRR